MAKKNHMGPSVTEAAEARIRQINNTIADLEDERTMLKARADRYRDSTMMESERAATAAEPYQTAQLPG